MGDGSEVERAFETGEDWPPREARVRAALWQAEGHLLRSEWVHAGRTLAGVLGDADEPDVVRGLRCLAAAGYRAREGDVRRARGQVEEARRRLTPHLPEYEEIDLEAVLAAVVLSIEGSARG